MLKQVIDILMIVVLGVNILMWITGTKFVCVCLCVCVNVYVQG